MAPQAISAPMPRNMKVFIFLGGTSAILSGMILPYMAAGASENVQKQTQYMTIWNACSLFGGLLLGRCSDRFPRKGVILFSACAIVASNIFAAVSGSWMLYITGALMNATPVIRAMQDDMFVSWNVDQGIVTSWIAIMQLSTTVGSIVGPLIGPYISSSPSKIQLVLALGSVLQIPVFFLLEEPEKNKRKLQWSLRKLIVVKSARTQAGIWYLFWIFLLVFMYNVCTAVTMPTIATRFDAKPEIFGRLQAISSAGATVGSFVAAPFSKRFSGSHPDRVVSILQLATFTCRMIQFTTTSLNAFLFSSFVWSFLSTGFINPIRFAIPFNFVSMEELGGFQGCILAIESLSGVVGPAIIGLLNVSLEITPVSVALFAVYALTPLYACLGYPRFVQPEICKMAELRRAKGD